MPQSRVGFIGLGDMGKPMAETLISKGFDMVVYDLRIEPLLALEKLGAKIAKSAKEIGELCNVVIVMVKDTAQAEVVILGNEGVLDGVKKDSLIIVMCTVAPAFCQRAARIAAKKGIGLIDAPVTGRSIGAATGSLTIMVGGEEQLLEKCRPILEAMGKKIFHIGSIGTGQVVKLAKNLISYSTYIASIEAISMVTKAGVDLDKFLDVARASSANCWTLQDKNWHSWWKRKVEEPDTLVGTYKVTHLMVDVARDLGLHLAHLESMARLDIGELLRAVPVEEL